MDNDWETSNTQNGEYKEKWKQAQKEIIDLKREVKDLKSEKIDLLTKIRELCLQLEKKELDLDECIQSFSKKTLESSSYVKKIVTLAEELENAHERLAELELKVQPVRSSNVGKFSSTPHVNHHNNSPSQKKQSPANVNLRRNLSNKGAGGTLNERHSAIDSGTNNKDVFNSLPTSKRLSEIHTSKSAHTKPTSEVLSIESDGSALSLSDSSESPSDDETIIKNYTKPVLQAGNQSIKTRRHQISQGDTLTNKIESGANISAELLKLPYTHWKGAHVLQWLTGFVGLPDGCLRRVAELALTGEKMMKLTDKDIEKKIGIHEPLIRKKILLALEDVRLNGSPGYLHANPSTSQLNDDWVANYWLPEELGLPTRIANALKSNCVDMRVLAYLHTIDNKEVMKLINCKMTKSELASLKSGVELMKILKYNLQVLKQRRELAETGDIDPMVWTNRRLQKWFMTNKLDKYLAEFRTSGLHGALLVLESSFGSAAICKVLNIPADVAKSCQLKEKLHNLLNPTKSDSSNHRSAKSPDISDSHRSKDSPISEDAPSTTDSSVNKSGDYSIHNKSNGLEKQASSMSKIRRSFRNLSKRVSKKSIKSQEKGSSSMADNSPQTVPRSSQNQQFNTDGTDGDTPFGARSSTKRLSTKDPSRTNRQHTPSMSLTSSAPNLSRHPKSSQPPAAVSLGQSKLQNRPKNRPSISSATSSESSSSNNSTDSDNSILISSKSKHPDITGHNQNKRIDAPNTAKSTNSETHLKSVRSDTPNRQDRVVGRSQMMRNPSNKMSLKQNNNTQHPSTLI